MLKTLKFLILLIISSTTYSQGNGQQCSDSCTTCSGILICINCECTVKLATNITSLKVTRSNDSNLVTWEISDGNDYYSFKLYRSIDIDTWEELMYGQGGKMQFSTLYFSYGDVTHKNTINYYKLITYSIDGGELTEDFTAINNKAINNSIVKRLDLIGNEVNSDYKGYVIEVYKNGEIKKLKAE